MPIIARLGESPNDTILGRTIAEGKMTSVSEPKNTAGTNKASLKQEPSETERANRVPESAENFEHILRRIVIAKAKAREKQ